ncbi:MAG: mechanosensitive ion channel family protein [Pyrobaculum sp.]
MKKLIVVVFTKIFFVIILSFIVYYILKEILPIFNIVIPQEYLDLIKGLIIATAGTIIVNTIGNAVIFHLRPTIREKAYAVGNTIKIVGFLFVVFLALLASRFGAEAAVLGGTVTGLILGFALQPVLGNLFAGLLIMATKFVTVGDTVRVATTQIPYQWAFMPSYKYFSPDYVVPGYKGRVVEVGLFYTTLLLDTGHELRIPNMVLLSSGVVDYTPQWSESQMVWVRVELPLSVIDVWKVEAELREVLKDFNVVAVDFSEQSDKDHVIIRIKLRVPLTEDWRSAKSEALKRVLAYREKLISEKLTRYLCLTRAVACDQYFKSLNQQPQA